MFEYIPNADEKIIHGVTGTMLFDQKFLHEVEEGKMHRFSWKSEEINCEQCLAILKNKEGN
jgi:hypothetical protein